MFARHEWIDVLQTGAIVAVFGVLIYAIWRLERQVHAWANMLAQINAKLAHEADRGGLGDAIARAWERILKLEARQDATEKGQPPPRGSRPTDPPFNRADPPP
jgi:hypothetical protein